MCTIQSTGCTIKPYSLQELAAIYGVSKPVMRNWLAPLKDELGTRRGWYYNTNQVHLIFSRLGVPVRVNANAVMSLSQHLAIPAG